MKSLFRSEKETSSTSSGPPTSLHYLAGMLVSPLELPPDQREALGSALSSHSPVRLALEAILKHQLETHLQRLVAARGSEDHDFHRAAYQALAEFRQVMFREATPRPVPRIEADPYEDQ